MNNLEPYACVKRWFGMGDHVAVEFDGESHTVQTLEGRVRVEPGDWIVGPGPANEHWVVDDYVFKKKYGRRNHLT
jgi:hypothetical protein